LDAVAVLAPLLQLYVYPDVPPAAFTVAEPVAPPLHSTAVAVETAVNTGGSVIVAVVRIVQPFASVTVT
jgi:hypothetical protein